MIRTRLDTVVRLREREEEKAAQEVAKAEQGVRAAADRRDEAQARRARAQPAGGAASDWETAELARQRALVDEKKAEREWLQAKRAAEVVRARFTVSHQRAEVVRRAAESRREEATREEARVELKQLDEVAGLMFSRKAG